MSCRPGLIGLMLALPEHFVLGIIRNLRCHGNTHGCPMNRGYEAAQARAAALSSSKMSLSIPEGMKL